MTLSRADFPHLKWSLLIFLSVLCAGSAAIAVSEHYVARAHRAQLAAQHQLDEQRNRLAGANEDRFNIKTYTFEYSALLDRKIIGNDQRLDWIEGLGRISKQHRVLNFKFTIAPQHPYILPPTLSSGNFKPNISDMTLQFDLLHEGQLMDFFDTLRSGVGGMFILDHCTMERNPDPDAAARLKAECTGGWLTLTTGITK